MRSNFRELAGLGVAPAKKRPHSFWMGSRPASIKPTTLTAWQPDMPGPKPSRGVRNLSKEIGNGVWEPNVQVSKSP